MHAGNRSDGSFDGEHESKGESAEEDDDGDEARGLLSDAEALFGGREKDGADSAAAIVRKVRYVASSAPPRRLTVSNLLVQVVPETDDPTLPTLTPRVWILGTLLCVLGGERRIFVPLPSPDSQNSSVQRPSRSCSSSRATPRAFPLSSSS